MADDTDFCYECDRVTKWAGETCQGCGREWGHPVGPVFYGGCEALADVSA
ncbi:hypothetical protein IT882_13185 [Microbacterium schleiferi]|uniref:Uncharacterized protein n=1 Tax=Microbacterium schleiferi TaxID=69362 RepID=A0A7S8MVR8_9MICO|nr:hypothetical protein [Microbacterium schleiferi]QPE04145.1 hypothetical protein IT882_13185 [Microbacterium schleiferi]